MVITPAFSKNTNNMALSPAFSKTSLSLFLLFFISLSSSYATSRIAHHDHPHLPTTSYSPKQPVEKLIRSLNLFPKDPVNIVHGDLAGNFVHGNIVEKKFSFFDASSGPSVQDLGHHAGYYSLPHSKAARMFYFFFESRNIKDDPVVIWLTGGPGCSSSLALFYENGPFKFSSNLSLVWNDYGWDKASNILFIDQPIGTGFSYTSDKSDIRHDENGVSNDLYDFLQEFFKQHPELAKNDFYITGESYAGHYVPALASRVHRGNKEKQGITINLKGFAIGNGLTNPAIQYQAYTDFALDSRLITMADHDIINMKVPKCEEAIKTCQSKGGETCMDALDSCQEIIFRIFEHIGNTNYYDIRKKCVGQLCYDFSKVVTLLNEQRVRDALGVGHIEFVSCSREVYGAMMEDWMKNLEVDIPSLLEDGIKMLVYAGEFDFICNWLGNSRWVHAMEWSGQKQFGASPTVQFLVDGVDAGSLNSYGPLSFLKVNGAGHMVPMDQPKAALQMLVNWMQGKLNATRA